MKISFFASSACMLAASSATAHFTDNLPKVSTADKVHDLHYRRNLELSQECLDAIDALAADPEFAAANAKKTLESELVDANEICQIDADSATCEYDLVNLPSHGDYVTACEGADGKIIDFDFGFSCSDSEVTFTINVSDDVCLPNVCSEDEFDEEVEMLEEELTNEFEDVLGGTGMTCTISAGNGMYSHISWIVAAVSSTAILLVSM